MALEGEGVDHISVVIPTYNRDQTLGRAVKSVLNQTYRAIEVIVVDDASTDKTEQLIKSINDPRLKYIKLETNQGANHARNIGISRASGKYIAFQDSDDEWFTEKLEKQVEFIETSNEDFDVVFCSYINVKGRDSTYLPKLEQLQRKGNLLQQLLHGNFITTQSLLIKVDVFREVGLLDEDMKRLQDWEFLIRVAGKCKVGFLDEPLLVTHFSDDSITSKPHLLPPAFLSIYNKHLSIIKTAGVEGSFCIQIAKSFVRAGNIKKAVYWHWESIKSTPWKISGVLSLFFSLLGRKGISVESRLNRVYQSSFRKKQLRANID